MNGRLENELKLRSYTKDLLEECPVYVIEWYEMLSASDKTAASCKDYVGKAKRFLYSIKADIKNFKAEDITRQDVVRYFNSIKVRENKNGDIVETSDSYRQTMWYCLNNFFDFLVKQNYIPTNYVAEISKPKNKDLVRINENRVLLTEEDFHKILKSVEHGAGNKRMIACQEKYKARDLSIMLIFMTTGMRESALASINVSDLDMKTGELTIIDKGKVRHSYILTSYTMDCIKEWLIDRREMLKYETDAMFISSLGNRISPMALIKLVKKYTEGAIGQPLSPHKLRSGFCSVMYNRTGDIEKVRRMVGHSNVATTQRYIVTGGNEKEESKDIMSDIFG